MAGKDRMKGKVAVVTGGASGFGKAIATTFRSEGAHVIITDLSQDAGVQVAQDIGATFVRADVTQRGDWENVLKQTLDAHGKLDVVVNNAGTTYPNKPTETVTDKDFDLVFNVNVRSIFLSTSVCLPYFLKEGKGGCFITIASTAGIRPRPGLAWYNSSKAAVINATKTMAVEYGPKQIRFNSVCPVFAAGTGLSSSFLGKEDNETNRAGFVATVPLGRSATPQDIANACLYLAGDEGTFITGVALEVDGGRCV